MPTPHHSYVQMIETALGQRSPDLSIVNGTLVNVYTGEIHPNTVISLSGDTVAAMSHAMQGRAPRDTRASVPVDGIWFPDSSIPIPTPIPFRRRMSCLVMRSCTVRP
jgi:hypothetical protein